MGRDMRDSNRPRRGGEPQDERESPRNRNRDFSNGNSYEREGYSSVPPQGRPDPRGERSYDSNGQRRPSRPPVGGSGGLGRGNSMVRQPYAGREPEDQSAYSNAGPSRPGGYTDYRNGGAPGGGGYDTPDRGGSRNGRSRMAEMARNVSKNMSRQLSSVMSRVGHAMEPRPRVDPYARGSVPRIYSNLSEEEALRLRTQAYRRSRIRMVARKWRLGRVQPNPIVYLTGILLAIVLVVMLSVGGGAGGVYAVSYYQRHVGDIQAIASLRDSQNSTIYDRNGKIIYYARGNSNFQTYVPLSQISLKLQAATIDTEDHSFYSNDGVDLYGTLRAALADVRAGGQAAQGGSTITQQLVKNIVLDDTRQSIQRKLNEAILAYGVTQQYTKAFILEMYLNTIDYGELNTGAEAAARNFFNLSTYNSPKGVVTANEQLSWPQAAILAALPNAPTEYQPDIFTCNKAPCQPSQWSNPFVGDPLACGNHIASFGPDWYLNPPSSNGHEWLVFCRAELVLYNVYQYGVPGHPEMDLTYQGYQQAVEQVYNILINQQVYSWQNTKTSVTGQSTNLAPHFVQYVKTLLDNQFGITDLSTVGLRIYTTLDFNLQQEAVNTIKKYIQHPYTETWYPTPNIANYWPPLSDPSNGNAHNGALVAIDQRDGDILAMVGSVDYNSKDPHILGANNITTSESRKMGSATKPLMYATAFQMGWTPGVMLQDEPICFPNASPDPTTASPVAPACKGYYVPQDYEEQNYSGTFPLRSQFDGSLNIAATEGMEFVGATPATSGNFISMVGRLGVTTIKENNMGPTTALGDQPIPLLQLTSAYGTLANLGQRAPARAILKITRNDGTVLWQAPGMPQTAQVISAQAAYMVTSVLTDNSARAPFFKVHNPLVLDDDPKYASIAIAGKTGTSSGNGGPDDIVTAGYTPYMTLGVWVGNTDGNDPLNPSIIGIAGAGYIFHDVMDWAAHYFNWDPNATFSVPPDMARGVFNCNTGLAPYQGSTPKDLNCAWSPLNIVKGYNSYDPYLLNGTDPTHRPDADWYIRGDEPITS